MSVRTNQYILLGLKLPYQKGDAFEEASDPYRDNGYKPQIQHHNGLSVISDGMGSQFTYIGRILHKSAIDQLLDGPILFRVPYFNEVAVIAALIQENFPEIQFECESLGTWFFTHYH